MKKLIVILLFFSFALTNLYSQQECPNVDNYSYMPPSIKTNDYVNILFLLDYSNSMLQKAFDNNTENEELGGYFKPSTEYCLDTEFSGTTESLFGNLSLGTLSAASDNLTTEQQQQLTSISDNASSSENPFPELFMNCQDVSTIDIGEIVSGFVGALIELITSPIESGALCLGIDDVMAFLGPFLQMAGAVLSSGGNGFGYQMNSARMTRSDYVTRLLTGGVAKELGKCVSEESNSCLGMGTSEDCCSEECIAIDIGMLLQLIVAASGVATGGTTTAASGATTVATEGVTALTGTSLSLFLCLPGLQSEDNCTQYTNEDECTSAEDNCTWLERHAVVLADNNTAVKWSDADSFVEDKDGDGKLCNMELYYTKNDTAAEENRNNSSPYTYDADNETQGCLEGILQDIQEWDKEYKPKLGGIVYSSAVDKTIDLNFDYTDLANAINEATVDSQSEEDVTDTDSAVTEAKEILSGDAAYTFNVNGSDITVPCTKNLLFYMSDGLWSGTDPIKNFDNIWNGDDLNNNIPGKQNIETYAFNMNLGETDDSAVNSMQNTAIFGGYRDYNNDGWPCEYSGYPNTSQTEAIHNSCYEWDGDLNGKPDNYFLYHTTYDYEALIRSIFEMAVEGALEQHYNSTAPAVARFGDNDLGLWVNAFYFPKMIYEAASNKLDTAKWRGDVQAYFLDGNNSIRENTEDSEDDDNTIKFTYEDHIISFITDTQDYVEKHVEDKDFDVSGSEEESFVTDFLTLFVVDYGETSIDNITIPDDCSNIKVRELLKEHNGEDKINPVWSALLDYTVKNDPERLIFYNDNTTKNIELTNNFDNSTAELKDIWCSANDEQIKQIIDKLRNGFSTDNESYYKLGDIINSAPIIVPPTSINNYHHKYHDLTYYDYTNSDTVRKRLPVVVVGGNDGMVHAFYIGFPKDSTVKDKTPGLEIKSNESELNPEEYTAGQEIWAFIPHNALPYLQWYMIEGEKYHIPKVDYNFTLVDASIGKGDGDESSGTLEKDSWRTLLIGTMGFGGKKYTFDNKTFSSSIFVLDITNTDPNNTSNTEAGDKPKFLWEAQIPDNTLALTQPTIIKLRDETSEAERKNGKWYVVIGSGPLNPDADEFVEKPKLYAFNLKTGENTTLQIDDRTMDNKSIGEIMEIDSDNDYSDDAIFFGTYNNNPNTRDNTVDNTVQIDSGSFYGITIENNDIKDIKKVYKLLDDNLTAPYFAKPTNTFDENGNVWVYTASGRLFNKTDMLTDRKDTNYIIGIKFFDTDDENNIININTAIEDSAYEELTKNDLLDSTNITVEGECITKAACYCGGVKVEQLPLDDSTDDCIDNLNNYNCESDCCGGNDDCIKVVEEYSSITLEGNDIPININYTDEDNAVADLANYMLADNARERGWFIELDRGESNGAEDIIEVKSFERAYSKPTIAGGLLNVVTYQPALNICSVRGTTSIHGLHYLTGTASDRPLLGNLEFMSGNAETSGSDLSGGKKIISGKTTVGIPNASSSPPPTGNSMTSVEGKDGTITTFVGSSKVTQQTPSSSSGVTSRILFKKVR